MTTDSKLFAIFKVAGERRFASRMELAREIQQRKLIEFSFERDGVRVYQPAGSIVEWVSFCITIGLLSTDLVPFVESNEPTWQGFEWSLASKIEEFAAKMNFSHQDVNSAVKRLISSSPARLPTPRAVHALIQPKCDYHIFYKAVTVESYQARLGYQVKPRWSFLIPDVFSDKDAS